LEIENKEANFNQIKWRIFRNSFCNIWKGIRYI